MKSVKKDLAVVSKSEISILFSKSFLDLKMRMLKFVMNFELISTCKYKTLQL